MTFNVDNKCLQNLHIMYHPPNLSEWIWYVQFKLKQQFHSLDMQAHSTEKRVTWVRYTVVDENIDVNIVNVFTLCIYSKHSETTMITVRCCFTNNVVT